MILRIVVTFCVLVSSAAAQTLQSWHDGAARKGIVAFVQAVTTKGGKHYVAPPERIAVFDNDGTLWAEQPMYFQLLFAIDRVKALAALHPEWQQQEPFASLLRGDTKAALAGGEKAVVEIVMAAHAGMTTEAFEQTVRHWLASARHPVKPRPYTDMVYQPMLELMGYLRAHGFKTYIVSGGGIEFMRVFSQQVYGIPPEQVVGSVGRQKFELRDGRPVLVKLPEIDFVDDGPGKPVGIQRFIGRRPLAAFGNSDGDLAMLQWTCGDAGRRLCLFVHHTDAKREWAYDRDSSVGRLDKGLDEARTRGWVVADMQRDWKTVFASAKR
jgi:phosphoglycolate phosphatase-like HAD superfamily hydrolase